MKPLASKHLFYAIFVREKSFSHKSFRSRESTSCYSGNPAIITKHFSLKSLKHYPKVAITKKFSIKHANDRITE